MRMFAVFVLLVTLFGVSYASFFEKLNWELKKGTDSVKAAVDTHLSKDAIENYRSDAQKVVNNLHEDGKKVLSSSSLAGDSVQKEGKRILSQGHQTVSDLLKKL